MNGLIDGMGGTSAEAEALKAAQKADVAAAAEDATAAEEVADVAGLLGQLAAKLEVQEHYEDILASAEANGIDGAGKNELKEALDNALAAIDGAATPEEVNAAKEEGILALDKTEGSAILDGYINTNYPNASAEQEAILSAAQAEIEKVTLGEGGYADNAAAGEAIDKIVEEAKLVLDKQDAKEQIEAAAGSTDDAAIREIVEEYLGEEEGSIGGSIGSAADKAEVDKLVQEALEAIENVYANEETLTDAAADEFREKHEEILDKNTDTVTAGDLDAIEAALDDYEKLPESVQNALGEEVKAELEDKKLEAVKDAAAEEYKQAYEAVHGTAPAAEDEVLAAIDGATSLDEVYDELKNAAAGLIGGLVNETDSDEVKAIADKYEALLERETAKAEAAGVIPDIAGGTDKIVDAAKAEIEGLRAEEEQTRADAEQALSDYADQLEQAAADLGFDGVDLTEALEKAQEELENAVGKGGIEDALEGGKAALEEALLDAVKDAADAQIAAAKDEALAEVTDAEIVGAVNAAAAGAASAVADAKTPEEVKEALEALDRFPDGVKNGDEGEEIRNILLHKKQQVMQSALEELGGSLNDVGDVIDDYIGRLEEAVAEIEAEGNTSLFDEKVSGILDDLFAEAQNAAKLEDYKNDAADQIRDMVESGDSVQVEEIAQDAIDAIGSIAYDPALPFEEQTPAIDEIVAAAEAQIELQQKKDEAKAEYAEAFEAVHGRAPTAEEAAEVNAAIDASGDLAGVNEALAAGVAELVEGILGEKDSAATEAIVSEAVEAIGRAESEANAQGAVADLDKIVSDAKAAAESQRAEEKADAKADVDAALDAVIDRLPDNLREEAEAIADAAKDAIDAGEYEDYENILDKVHAKLEVLEAYDEAVQGAQDAGYDDTAALEQAKDEALDAIEDAVTAGEIADAKEEGLLGLDKAEAVIELEGYLTDEDPDHIRDLVTGADGGAAQIEGAQSAEEIEAIVEKVKTEIDAARFEEENDTADFDGVASDDKASLEEALENYEKLDEVVRDQLDETAREEGYAGYPSKVEDMIAKAELEAAREEIIAQVEELVREHDGENVKDILAEQLDKVNGIEYRPHTSDEDRADYLESVKEQLNAALEEAQMQIGHAQHQQRVENQLAEEIADKVDSGRYSEEQKEALDQILAQAKDEIADVLAGMDEASQAAAAEKLEQILSDALDKLDESPVSSVTVGDIKPDKTPSVEGGTGDYEEGHDGSIWGIVTNVSGMPGSIELVIEETDADKQHEIESAAKNGALVAAEGSALTESEMRDLVAQKDIKCVLDIYLRHNGVIITEFEGYYQIKVLLPEQMRSMSGLQVVYVADDGSVQVYDTAIEDGMYLTFTTAHFSNFYILGDKVVDLWWLIILLAVILVIELILIVWLLKQRRDADKKGEEAYAFTPAAGLLAVHILPNGAVIACIVLGVLVAAAAVAIAVLLLQGRKAAPQAEERAGEDAAQDNAAQDNTAQDNTAQDNAAQDNTAQDR